MPRRWHESQISLASLVYRRLPCVNEESADDFAAARFWAGPEHRKHVLVCGSESCPLEDKVAQNTRAVVPPIVVVGPVEWWGEDQRRNGVPVPPMVTACHLTNGF